MNRYLPVQGRRCASAGLMLVAAIAIVGTGPLWITTAALILITIFTAVLWKTPSTATEKSNRKTGKTI
jgi:hypothetical protein